MLAALRQHCAEFSTPVLDGGLPRSAAQNPQRASEASDEGAFAGDVSPSYTFEVLKAEADAMLIDVRTKAEWAFVGAPNLADMGKTVNFIEWLHYPTMALNESFLTELDRCAGANKDAAIFFICRSGQRSRKAAIAATEQGFSRAYNVETGFEGNLDVARHRGSASGWKVEGLPWGQT